MPIEPDQPGGSHDPTRAQDPVDPTRAQDPVDPTRAQDATYARPDSRREPVGAEPRRRDPSDDDDRSSWWLWALLAAVLIGIVLFALLRDNDDEDDSVGTADQTETVPPETAPEDTAVEDTTAETAPEDTVAEEPVTEDTPATTAADDGDAAAPDEGAGEDPGTVTTPDGTDLFTLVEGDEGDAERLAPYADQDVTGEGVFVLDVIDGQGFWIGADDQQRIFAHTSADTSAEVQVGQRISFDGFLEPNPPEDSADAHDIPEDRGAELHRQQGHHIELRSVTPA